MLGGETRESRRGEQRGGEKVRVSRKERIWEAGALVLGGGGYINFVARGSLQAPTDVLLLGLHKTQRKVSDVIVCSSVAKAVEKGA
jgi:hypothetical protein